MKTILIVTALLLSGVQLSAQVKVRPLPSQDFEERIRDFVYGMRVVDTHEHLMNPESIKNGGMLDFMLLLHHYADDDIKSAGMLKQDFDGLLSDSLGIQETWKAVKPYWEGSGNTAYNRAVMLAADSLFGIKRIDETTVDELSDKIKKAYQADWLNYVLRSKCRLDYVIVDGEDRSFGDPDMFRYVKRFDYINIDSRKSINAISERHKTKIRNIDDLEKSLEADFQSAIERKYVAVKIGIAYNRILFFEDVSREEAEKSLKRILKDEGDQKLPFAAVKPLQDFMTHRVLQLAGKYNLPVQIHTGLQAGDGNIIENSNPTHLANLFLKYRDIRFIIMHGSYPFGGELATLAKNFRNVYIDMCWLYIISPSYAERYLHEWLETVPANKIMAFGGDFHNVEGVYGHLLFARQVVANVLVKKVQDGYFSEEEAINISRMLLHDNAIRIFDLRKQ